MATTSYIRFSFAQNDINVNVTFFDRLWAGLWLLTDSIQTGKHIDLVTSSVCVENSKSSFSLSPDGNQY